MPEHHQFIALTLGTYLITLSYSPNEKRARKETNDALLQIDKKLLNSVLVHEYRSLEACHL